MSFTVVCAARRRADRIIILVSLPPFLCRRPSSPPSDRQRLPGASINATPDYNDVVPNREADNGHLFLLLFDVLWHCIGATRQITIESLSVGVVVVAHSAITERRSFWRPTKEKGTVESNIGLHCCVEMLHGCRYIL